MRFDELVLKVPDDEIRVKFHPRMTVLSGLGPPERRTLAETIVGALTGGEEQTALRCIDGTGRAVIILSGGGAPVRARHDDGSGDAPVSDLMASPDALRDLMLVHAVEPGPVVRGPRPDEPRELREARASLVEVDEQLQQALEEQQRAAALQAEIEAVEEQIQNAEDGAARREYAQVLAQLERVQAEAATLEAGPDGIDPDRQLLATAALVAGLAARWKEAAVVLQDAIERFGGSELLHGPELARLAALPDAAPQDLELLAHAVVQAEADVRALDLQLQSLTVGKLPTVSEPLVAELGLLDQSVLWQAADRVVTAQEEVSRIQLSLGGLGGDADGSAPVEIEDMEAAHRDLDAAQQAAESVRVPGVAGTGFGLAVALAGAVGDPLFIPLGMLISTAVGTFAILLPRRRVARAAAAERTALDRAGAPSYLGFHLRRVDAGMDPKLRDCVGAARQELQDAKAAWAELVGPGADLEAVRALEPEVRAYHETLVGLGSVTDEIERLRAELAERAHPSVAAARSKLAECCRSVGLAEVDLHEATAIVTTVTTEIDRGRAARRQIDLERAETAERDAARELQSQLDAAGLGTGPLPARVQELESAVAAATAREEARAKARPTAEIEAELVALKQRAERMHRPEWDTVTAEEADAPDVDELQERRTELQSALAEARPSVDVARLSDRHAALDRRVAALEAKFGEAADPAGDPAVVAEIQEQLAVRLRRAAGAGPHGDAMPALLDEVLDRVPVDRKWDLLDHLYQLSEAHQLVYLSDDPFVAAWARQRAEGSITLLEPEPEPV